MELARQAQILDVAVCISLHANALGNSWIPLFSQLCVNSRADYSLLFIWKPVKIKISAFIPVVIPLKK